MKTAGWIFIVFAILNFVVFVIASAAGESEAAGTKIGAAIMLGVLGAYLIHRGNQKEQEQKEKDNWNNG